MKNRLNLIATCIFLTMGCAIPNPTSERNEVTLYLDVDNARSVAFACSLDQFRLRPTARIDADTWRIRVPANRQFTYFYLIDGEAHVPECGLKERDDFGSENCIYVPEM